MPGPKGGKMMTSAPRCARSKRPYALSVRRAPTEAVITAPAPRAATRARPSHARCERSSLLARTSTVIIAVATGRRSPCSPYAPSSPQTTVLTLAESRGGTTGRQRMGAPAGTVLVVIDPPADAVAFPELDDEQLAVVFALGERRRVLA